MREYDLLDLVAIDADVVDPSRRLRYVIVSLLCSTHPHRYQRFLQDLQEIETISFHETHARL